MAPLRLLRGALAALLLLAGGAAALAQEAVRVESIEFSGLSSYSSQNLKYRMRTKEGKPLDRELLAQDVAMLRTYFEDFSFVEEPVAGGGVRFRFTVKENPLVSRVEFSGHSSFAEEELRSVVDTRTGDPLAGFRLEKDVLSLERKYREAGHHWVEVRADVLEDEGARRVVFRIVEGPPVDVEDVIFEGNAAIPAKKLLPEMALRPGNWVKFDFGTSYVERRLEEDRIAIEKYYHDQGFLEARAWIRGVSFNGDRDEATITVAIEEGEPWVLGEVQVQGGATLTDRAKVLARADRLVPGQRWLKKDVDRVVRDMEEEAKRQGFSDARVEVLPLPRAEGRVEDLRLTVDEGKRFTIRFLDVSGNVLTQDRVVLREFTVAPGDPLDSAAVAKSVRRVLDTQYFSSAVPVLRETDDPGRKDVEIRVEENPRTSQLRVGAGISSDTGLFGTFSVTFRNFDIGDPPARLGDFLDGRAFKGAGQTLSIVLMPGTDLSTYRLAFTEPWLLDRPVSAGFEVSATESTIFQYDEDRTALELSLQRRWLLAGEDLDDAFALGIRPRVESVVVDDIAPDAPPNAFSLEGRNSIYAASVDFFWRRIDQEHATERGWRASVISEFAGGPLGGDFDFWKNTAEVVRVLTLWRDLDERAFTLKFRAAGGMGMPTGDGHVPLVERLFAGGASGIGAVRGYSYSGLGPHGQGDPSRKPWRVLRSIENSYGEPMGGDAMAAGSVEYGVPLFGDVLRGAAFLDGGNVGFNSGELRRNWRVTWGVGLLVKVPFFGAVPLRFDFAWPIKEVGGDDRQVLSFEFSTFF